MGDLLYTLGLINNSKQLDVVFYVLDNTDPANNLYIGTIRKTVEMTGISLGTVSAIFKKMQEVDMIVKQSNGVYKVKPNLLMKGDDNKKQRLVISMRRLSERRSRNMRSQMMEMQWTENETMWVDEHFWGMISCLDERLKVLDYLMNHRAGQYAIGTIREISKDTGLSVGRVQKFLKALEKKSIIQRKGNGVYILPQAMLPVAERGNQMKIDYIRDFDKTDCIQQMIVLHNASELLEYLREKTKISLMML